jgi:hypothetical protein
MADVVSVEKIALDGLKYERRTSRIQGEAVQHSRSSAVQRFEKLIERYGSVEDAFLGDLDFGKTFVDNVPRAMAGARARGREIEIE